MYATVTRMLGYSSPLVNRSLELVSSMQRLVDTRERGKCISAVSEPIEHSFGPTTQERLLSLFFGI